MKDYKEIAKSAPIFKNLTEQEKNVLLKDGIIRHFEKKDFLFHHGDLLAHFYIICAGNVQISRNNADGVEKTLDILTAQDIICDNKIYEPNAVYQFNAIAVSDVIVIEFPKTWLKENAKKYGEFALNLLALISHKAQMAEIEVEHKSAMSATQIVACFLQKLCLVHDLNPQDFTLPYSKTLIASRLGMELETFSRTLSKLKEYGIIVEGSHVTIKCPEIIEEKVCDHCSIEEDCHVHSSFKKKF